MGGLVANKCMDSRNRMKVGIICKLDLEKAYNEVG